MDMQNSLLSLLFFLSAHLSASTTLNHRRILHHPYFPLESFPPSQSPQSQPPHSQQPKLPFTSSSSSSSSSSSPSQKSFFPTYHSPPPPSSPAIIATFPANVSSLLFPHSSTPKHHPVLAIAVSVSLISFAIIAAASAFVYYHRHRRYATVDKAARSDSLRLYPPNIPTSDGSHKPRGTPNTSSEFLYLGTLVNSTGVDGGTAGNSANANVAGVGTSISAAPYQKLGSPELKPLPPLPRHNFKLSGRSTEATSSVNEEDNEEEEFFSPRGSSGRKETLGCTGSGSRRVFKLEVDNFGSRSFNSRTPSYPCSNSASPTNSVSNASSPHLNLSPTSLESKSPDSIINFRATSRPFPSNPLSSSPSLFSSPSIEGDIKNNRSLSDRNSSASRQKKLFPENSDGVPKRTLPVRLPPPPPPPPPPPRFWEVPVLSRVVHEPYAGPPPLLNPSRSVLQNVVDASSNEPSENYVEIPKPKLKPLHWDKVKASSDRAMVWDQLKPSSFQLNEEMIESLFMVNNSTLNPKDNGRRQSQPHTNQENRVLDPKKSQNIAILLRALNVTVDEVCEALREGNSDTLGTELLESLLKMAPSKEEEHKLREFKDESPFKLGPAEKFLKTVLDLPFAFKRVDAMLYIANFDSEVEYLWRSFGTLEAACMELRNSRMFMRLLEAVLKTGNRMNDGTNRGDAQAFKLDTLLKLVDIKGTDGKTTLLHFVVQEIIRAEGLHLYETKHPQTEEKNQQSALWDDVDIKKLGLQVVSGLSRELTNVKKAAAMDSCVLINEVEKLSRGIAKVSEVMKMNEETGPWDDRRKFSELMSKFLKKGEVEIVRIQGQEGSAMSLVKEITQYFHGNLAEEEAHPFRIFMVVRDFLTTLDQVCKEVGKANERTLVGFRQFPVGTNSSISVGSSAFPELSGSGRLDGITAITSTNTNTSSASVTDGESSL